MLRRPTLNAFTLIELLVVIGIIALLIGILLPVLGRARTTARDVRCLANLNQIVTAVNAYAVDNRRGLPRVHHDVPDPVGGNTVRAADALAGLTDPFAGLAPRNDVPAAMFLLLRQDYVTSSELFVSPGLDTHTPDAYAVGGGDARGQTTFTRIGTTPATESNLSYGYSNPYPGFFSAGGPLEGMARFRPSLEGMSSAFVVLADRGPACCLTNDGAGEPINRSNVHGETGNERGQHMAFGDGHVAFSETPESKVTRSWGKDALYTGYADSFAKDERDTVILPMLWDSGG